MAIVFTFNFDTAHVGQNDYGRLKSMFERFGWQSLGDTAYRYPRLATEQPVEDWLNHVIPALMLFRTYTSLNPQVLTSFTLDAQSSSGFNPDTNAGHIPLRGEQVTLYPPPANRQHFGEQNLRDWIDSIDWPYAAAEAPIQV